MSTYVNFPFWDQWDNLDVPRSIGAIFQTHNENRIILARAIFAIDTELFHGTDVFAILAATVFQIGTCAVFVALIIASRLPQFSKMLIVTAVVAISFWWYQYENFSWGFQTQYTGVVFFSVAAIAIFAAAPDRWSNAIGAMIVVAIASSGLSNGMMAGLVITAFAFLLARPPIAVFMTAFMTGLMSFYLFGYHSPNSFLSAFAKPLKAIVFPFVYIGAPLRPALTWTGLPDVPAAAALGLGVVITAIIAAVGLWRRRDCLDAIDRFAAIVATFILITSCMVSLARSWTDPGYLIAFPSRYLTMLVPLYGALLILLARTNQRVALGVATTAMVALPVISQGTYIEGAHRQSSDRYFGATALMAEVKDDAAIRHIYPAPEIPTLETPRLKALHRSIFSNDWAQWLGNTITSPPSDYRWSPYCVGAVESSGGSVASGWAKNGRFNFYPDAIVLIDSTDKVIGFGIQEFHGVNAVKWRGHFQGSDRPRGVAVFSNSRNLCRF